MSLIEWGKNTLEMPAVAVKKTNKAATPVAGLVAIAALITALGGGAGIAKLASVWINGAEERVDAETDAAFAWVACMYRGLHVEERAPVDVRATCAQLLVGHDHLLQRLDNPLGLPQP